MQLSILILNEDLAKLQDMSFIILMCEQKEPEAFFWFAVSVWSKNVPKEDKKINVFPNFNMQISGPSRYQLFSRQSYIHSKVLQSYTPPMHIQDLYVFLF